MNCACQWLHWRIYIHPRGQKSWVEICFKTSFFSNAWFRQTIGCSYNWYSAKHTTDQGKRLLLPYYLKHNVGSAAAFVGSAAAVELICLAMGNVFCSCSSFNGFFCVNFCLCNVVFSASWLTLIIKQVNDDKKLDSRIYRNLTQRVFFNILTWYPVIIIKFTFHMLGK